MERHIGFEPMITDWKSVALPLGECRFNLVSVAGFEPATTCFQGKYATRLRYTLILLIVFPISHRFDSLTTCPPLSIRSYLRWYLWRTQPETLAINQLSKLTYMQISRLLSLFLRVMPFRQQRQTVMWDKTLKPPWLTHCS